MRYLAMAALLTVTACYKVPAGYTGVKVYMLGSGKGDMELLGPGRYWVGINEELFLFPLFKQTYPFTQAKTEGSALDESFTFQTGEGLSVNADIGVTLSVERDKVLNLFTSYRRGIDEIIHSFLRNEIRTALNISASKYKAEDAYGDGKHKLMSEVSKIVQAKMTPQGIIIDDLYVLGNFRLPDSVVASLNAKIQATQLAEKAENELRQAKAEAQKKIAEAEGEAQALRAKAEGEAQANRLKLSTIDVKLIEFEKVMNDRKAIDRWNGILPATMCSSATPFLSLR